MERIRCCGKEMRLKAETLQFQEYYCEKCGDVVYVKKAVAARPQMIDD